MKKGLLTIGAFLALTITSSLNAQIYSENFENSAAWDPTTAWTISQLDLDTNQWGLYDLSAEPGFETMGICAGSASWATVALTPDNFFISPPINLTTYTSTGLSFKYAAIDAGYPAENFSVYVVKNLADLATATAVYTETMTTGAVIYTKVIDISALSGSADADSVQVIFRHHNCTDQNILLLDDVKIFNTLGLTEVATVEVNAFPNPVLDVLNINLKENISSVNIISTEGKLISSNDVNNLNATSVNVSELISGVYMYQVTTTNGSVITNKFVKK